MTDKTTQQQRDELLHLLESSFRALATAEDVRTYRFDIGYVQGMLDAMDILRVDDAGLFSAEEMHELFERKRVVGNETVKRIEGEPADDVERSRADAMPLQNGCYWYLGVTRPCSKCTTGVVTMTIPNQLRICAACVAKG